MTDRRGPVTKAGSSQRPAPLFSSAPTSANLNGEMDSPTRILKPGSLWPSVLERTAHARLCGAIQSLPTSLQIIEQQGVAFQVRVAASQEAKQAAKAASPRVNPFLPYDPDLFVADLSPTHLLLLNKFNVIDHHLLIVTRAFEDQETLPTRQDCEALVTSLEEFDGLAFYNAGPMAGASQPHKHLQMIPLPAERHPRLPIEPLLAQARMDGATGTAPGLPFQHAYAPMNPAWLDGGRESAEGLRSCYRALLAAVRMAVEPDIGGLERTGPYNLLATRRWLLLVPRSKEYWEGMSINALGLAGMLLAKDEDQVARLRAVGPMAALRHVTRPR